MREDTNRICSTTTDSSLAQKIGLQRGGKTVLNKSQEDWVRLQSVMLSSDNN